MWISNVHSCPLNVMFGALRDDEEDFEPDHYNEERIHIFKTTKIHLIQLNSQCVKMFCISGSRK